VFAAVPHGGSWAALLLSMIPAARDIIPSKSHFKDLKKFYYPDNTVNFISHQELKIWPKKNALLKSHIDKVIKGTNHDSIIHDDEFFKEVLAFIESEKGKIKQVL
jgi:aspartate carbamoyltransferase regulatory subunit